ncbi:MAG: ADP-glyceromanno-heptose 6-epimerase [Candidatus Rhabdochlamydia sp.]|jgi:ADP-L-glycero-D-manno-heptose 6-epimerase|nr:ADP-L-glycero-D-manno-heptose 6-epimerase [Chlamydiota bacterium]
MNNDQFIVITGAAGLIGSCCVRYLNDLGFTKLILVDDIKKTNKWKNLLNKKYVAFISKYQLFDWLKGREKEIEAFIHLGACSDTLEQNEEYLMQNNLHYSIRLAEYALRAEHRFIYASSAATYGDGSQGFIDDHARLEYLKPLNSYGFSKYAFDLWLKQQGVLDQVVGLKYFNVFGPNENHKGRMASMIYKMTLLVQKEKLIRLFASSDPDQFADGEQSRDFIYVKDACEMTCEFLKNSIGGIFNIGSGATTTWRSLALAIFKTLKTPLNITFIKMPKELAIQYQNYTCADMQKYIKNVNQPKLYSIEDAVEDYVQNYLIVDKRW